MDKEIRLPHLLGEGCVLQRGKHTRIWGWYEAGRKMTASFQGKASETTVQPDGRFEMFCSCEKPGGPFCLKLCGEDGAEKTIEEVYVGDVFVCAGQSNMELPMERVKERFPEEFSDASAAGVWAGRPETESWMQAYEMFTGVPRQMKGNAQVHYYKAPECAEFAGERDDHEDAGWMVCSGNALAEVSAFSYFFGSRIADEQKTPVGIINISLGGTPVEAWTSPQGLAAYPELLAVKKQLESDEKKLAVCRRMEEEQAAWERHVLEQEKHASDAMQGEMQIPGYFARQGLTGYCGVLWLKRTFRVSAEQTGERALLRLGTLNGSDRTYVNGVFVGETGYSFPPRRYEIPAGLLKEGDNEICIRMVCHNTEGRATPGKPYEIVFAPGARIDLKGTWHYEAKGRCEPAPEWDPVIRRPCGLFQGMVAPCLPASVKGVVWYQGESNDRQPQMYEVLLKGMIQDWRGRWGQEKLPFVLVQLPVCGVDTAGGGAWAVIREAQRRAAELPDTAAAVTLDLGEYYDLHPLDKKGVAHRAYLAAEHLIYKREVVWQGPRVCRYEVQENCLSIYFDTKDGKDLCLKDAGQPGEFEAAGSDGKFVPVPVKAEKDRVRIDLEGTDIGTAGKVCAVRYAWTDAPMRGLLFNQEGLPAEPFCLKIS